jgi:hypothetical protein
MAQPNIVDVVTIRGNTVLQNVITSNTTNLVANPAASGKVFKINTLMISNANGTTSADITAGFFRDGTEYKIAHTIPVPADSTLVLLSKDIAIYLQETDYIRLNASANNFLHAVCSYEEIS